MKRYLPFAIILGVFLVALGTGVLLFHSRKPPPPRPPQTPVVGKPGAEPAHRHGVATAPVALEEFGDFECLPCFMLWPILKNLEKDYGQNLSIIFRQRPLPQHRNALDAARAAEAAGVQGRFWEMHDSLYQSRGVWVRALDPRPYFNVYASYIGLDLERFKRDMDGEEVARRITADRERAASFGIDRTPVILINGERIPFSPNPDADIRGAIDKALGTAAQP